MQRLVTAFILGAFTAASAAALALPGGTGGGTWAAPSLADANYTVELPDATYVGGPAAANGSSGVAAFLGLRYALPPTGARRFRRPVAVPPAADSDTAKKAVVAATEYPPLCIQGGSGSAVGGAGSEDCLFVNVWAPSNATRSSRLPVVVWLHGGGYTRLGSLYFPLDEFVTGGELEVVSVFVQYRLHALGFLATTLFEDSANGDANAGLLDQRLALHWVQQNIHLFGGDPAKVTIAGQSAGAGSVMMQLLAYGGRNDGLFRAAIGQSMYSIRAPPLSEADTTFASFANLVGCASTTNTSAASTASTAAALACLRDAPVSAIMPAVASLGGNAFVPAVDGSFLVDFPNTLLAAGRFAKVPFLGGSCTDDGAGYYGQHNTSSALVSALQSYYPNITNATLEAVLDSVYPLATANSSYEGSSAANASAAAFSSEFARGDRTLGDAIFACPVVAVQRHLLQSRIPTYAYRFNTPNPNFPAWEGVAHASEQYWMFNGLNPMTEAGSSFALEIYAYWTSFARYLDPSVARSPASPRWPARSTRAADDSLAVLQLAATASAEGDAVALLGFTRMTPVQASTIPLLLTHKDVIVQ
ncbi:hypothetical protein HK405_008468, partial [Cladochytrium tenue]